MTQARVYWKNPEKFALLSIYEQRISRKIERNEARLNALQTERKAALEAALEEARLLAELAESKGQTYDPAPDFESRIGFVFSAPEFTRQLDLKRRLLRASALQPRPVLSPKRAAKSDRVGQGSMTWSKLM